MKKVKLFKIHNSSKDLSYDRSYHTYDQIESLIVDSCSDWEELTDDEYQELLNWVLNNKGLILVDHSRHGFAKQTILEIREIERKKALKRAEEERKRAELEKEKKLQRSLKFIGRKKKKFEAMQKEIAELERLKNEKKT